jgi:hypothetical protein
MLTVFFLPSRHYFVMLHRSRARTAYSRASGEAIAIFSGSVESCIIDYIGCIAQMPKVTTAADRRSQRRTFRTCFTWLTRPRDSQELLELSQAKCTCDSEASLGSSHQAGLEVIEQFGPSFRKPFFVLAEYILLLFCASLEAKPVVEGQDSRQRVHRLFNRQTWPGTWQEMLPHGPKDTMLALLSLIDTNPPTRLQYSIMTAIGRIIRNCHPLVVPVLISSHGTVVYGIMESISECQQILMEQTRSDTPDVEALIGMQNCLASIADFLQGLFRFSHETQRTIFHAKGGGQSLLNAYIDAALLCRTLAEKNHFPLSESVIAQSSHVLEKFGSLGGKIYDDCPDSRKKETDAALVELFDKNSTRHFTLEVRTWLRLLQLFQHLEVRQQCAAPGCLYTLANGPLWQCAGCVRVTYCSRACQKRAWRHDIPHRSVCSVLAELQKKLQLPYHNVLFDAPEEVTRLPYSDAWLPLANTALDHFVRLVAHNMGSMLETTDRPSSHPKAQPQAPPQAQPQPQTQAQLQAQPPSRSCRVCEKPGTRQCRGCTEVHYCGKSHAKKVCTLRSYQDDDHA